MKLFGLYNSDGFAKRVADHLDIQLARHVERHFEDGEPYVRSDENVRGEDVYVLASLYGDQYLSSGEKFTTLLFFVGSLTDASAGRVTVVIPYLAYSRQDRKTESRAPICTKYTAVLLERVGVDRLLTLDVHNLSAFQNAFRIPADNLEARPLLMEHLTGFTRDHQPVPGLAQVEDPAEYVFLSPDSGGFSRVRRARASFEERTAAKGKVGMAYLDKERNVDGVYGHRIVGDVRGKKVVVVDDMIASGGTIRACAEAVEAGGGVVEAACVTHGLFVGDADENLAKVRRVIVTDTIPPFRLRTVKPEVVSTSKLVGRAIKRTYEQGGSLSELMH